MTTDSPDAHGHGGSLDVFDATASVVFASLCRVAMADRTVAERLLAQTFVESHHRVTTTSDRRGLLSIAHRLYVDESPASSHGSHGSQGSHGTGPSYGVESSSARTWSRDEWRGIVPDALASMTPAERAALDLAVMEGYTISEIAKCLGVEPADAQQLLVSAHGALDHAGIGGSARDVLQQCELWFDDGTRD